jgi:hypothetical protein
MTKMEKQQRDDHRRLEVAEEKKRRKRHRLAEEVRKNAQQDGREPCESISEMLEL